MKFIYGSKGTKRHNIKYHLVYNVWVSKGTKECMSSDIQCQSIIKLIDALCEAIEVNQTQRTFSLGVHMYVYFMSIIYWHDLHVCWIYCDTSMKRNVITIGIYFDRMMCTGGMEICLRLPWPFCTNMQSKETSLKSRKPCGKSLILDYFCNNV